MKRVVYIVDATQLELDYILASLLGRNIARDPMGFGIDSANGGYWVWEDPQDDHKVSTYLKIGSSYSPTQSWALMGPVIDQHPQLNMWLEASPSNGCNELHGARIASVEGSHLVFRDWYGPTKLIAVARCVVAHLMQDSQFTVPGDLK